MFHNIHHMPVGQSVNKCGPSMHCFLFLFGNGKKVYKQKKFAFKTRVIALEHLLPVLKLCLLQKAV